MKMPAAKGKAKNHHTAENGTIWTSPLGGPVTELAKRGNRLCLYTEDNEIYQLFRKSRTLIRAIPYVQGGLGIVSKGKTVAYDLYFPLKVKSILVKLLERHQTAPDGNPGVLAKKGR